MIKLLKSRKGVTLVELLAGMVVSSIVMVAASAVLIPILNVYAKANDLAECNTLLDNVANQIIGDLLESTAAPKDLGTPDKVTITIDATGDVIYTVDADGVLCKEVNSSGNANPVFEKNFYKKKKVSFICEDETDDSEPGDKAYRLTVSITPDDGETISRIYKVRPLVLNQD